jgi:hypothetical protein
MQLMHPEIRARRSGGVPPRIGTVDHIHVPRILPQAEHRIVLPYEHGAAVPVMPGAGIGHESRRRRDVGLVAVQLRHPHDVGSETRIGLSGEQNLLDFGCAPKTLPSGRGDEHDHANFADVRVEC